MSSHRMLLRRILLGVATGLLASLPVIASELQVSVEIPRLNVAEYHRPYVAIWIENHDRSSIINLAVWYDVKMKNNEGEKWLKDMVQWWRRSGRSLTMPVDGVSGATRAPGKHEVTFQQGVAPLGDLPAGEYKLIVEAAREVGGRELVQIPFTWPVQDAQNLQGQGSSELGAVQLNIKP